MGPDITHRIMRRPFTFYPDSSLYFRCSSFSGEFSLFAKEPDFLTIAVRAKNEVFTEEISFEVDVDFFSLASETSLGIMKLQGWHCGNNCRKEGKFRLIQTNWNKTNRCPFKYKGKTELKFSIPLVLLLRISTTGHLKVILNGIEMTPDSDSCNDDKWSDVNKVKVTLFDMKPYDRTTNDVLDIHYEINHLISKFNRFDEFNF